jgi:peptidoglycan/xylan/chitin deacetylase (PgdA/CDA1 family)/glycosyltransferase involved in cell wall biosynthesis
VRTATNLLFHYVAERAPSRRLTVSLEALRRAIAKEREADRRPASLADYLSSHPPGADRFTISFDDAHASVALAAPLLSELGVTPTLFVPTAYVGASDELLDWDDLRRLRDEGWVLGSHTHTHPRMGLALYDETPADHARRLLDDELLRSRERMERELGEAPLLFAYPYGEASELARRAVQDAGFEAAFTVDGIEWSGDRLRIPRADAMEPETIASDGPIGISVVVPAFDRVRILSDVVTRLASLEYPEDRYEVIVVDDGSREDPSPIFREMPANVRLVRQGDDRFRAGQARQRGAGEARFPYLAFLDADVAVGPDFLWHLDWVHQRVPDAVLLGYLSGYNLHDLGHLHTPDGVIGRDLASLPIIPDRSREPTLRRCLDNLDWLEEPWPLTYTGNLSLPASLLASIGGFAGEFVGWGLEDVDLGIRLARAGARFVFSRFALGFHIVDPREPLSRNPFRARAPTREDFAGYLANLERLRRRHEGDPAVARYVERSLADIEETCSKPGTVGIEMGGEARIRTPHHRRLHRVAPGGVPKHELLDRIAYAEKVGARTVYLLGGEPADHPAFFEVLEAAARTVRWVSMETAVHPFAEDELARRARASGLRGAVAIVHAFDREVHEALHGAGTYAMFLRGLDALHEAGVELAAHVVVTPESAATLEPTLIELASRAMKVEEISVLSPELAPLAEAASGRTPTLR